MSLKNITTKLIIAIIALQIINMSVDTNDFKPLLCNNAISDFNYLNSMAEYVTEVIMKKTDAFPEFFKHNGTQSQSLKHIDIKLYQPIEFYVLNVHNIVVEGLVFHYDDTHSYQFCKEINPPPPKA